MANGPHPHQTNWKTIALNFEDRCKTQEARIRELEASARQVADKAIGRITELEAAIKAAMENEVSLDSERGSTWHILNDALAPQSDADCVKPP